MELIKHRVNSHWKISQERFLWRKWLQKSVLKIRKGNCLIKTRNPPSREKTEVKVLAWGLTNILLISSLDQEKINVDLIHSPLCIGRGALFHINFQRLRLLPPVALFPPGPQHPTHSNGRREKNINTYLRIVHIMSTHTLLATTQARSHTWLPGN